MSVLVEFSVGPADFAFADALAALPDLSITFERIVPVTADALSFVWATGGDLDTFEREARRDDAVESLNPLSDLSNGRLYRVSWTGDRPLVDAVVDCGGVILAAGANERWFFRVRFPDYDSGSSFYDRLDGVSLEVDRISSLADEVESEAQCDLTPEQREAVTLALEWGYFATPRNATLSDLADELDISQQAVSDRVRRANEKILREALRPDDTDVREAGLSSPTERLDPV